MTPLLVLCGISTPSFLAAAVGFRGDPLAPWMFAAAIVLPLGTFFAHVYLMVFDKAQLATEDYRLRERAIRAVVSKTAGVEASGDDVVRLATGNPNPMTEVAKLKDAKEAGE